MYGKSRYTRSKSRYTGRGRGASAPRSYLSKPSYTTSYGKRVSRPPTAVTKFATVAYAKDVEKKYFDVVREIKSGNNEGKGTATGYSIGIDSRINQGVEWRSGQSYRYSALVASTTQTAVPSNMLRGIGTGATVNERIGNKITPVYLKGTILLSAATQRKDVATPDLSAGVQHGENSVLNSGEAVSYMRTTYKCLIVKDLQVNSTDNFIPYDYVMETSNGAAISGVYSELSVSNLDRFVVLKEWVVELDADDPQKSLQYMISGKDIGNIRYNASASDAYTDKGIHFIYAATSRGVDGVLVDTVKLPSVIVSTRVCYRDT